MGSWVERTRSNTAAGGPSEVEDCGMGQARLQLVDPTRWRLADPVAPHPHIDKLGGMAHEGHYGERSRPRNSGLQRREIKPQITD